MGAKNMKPQIIVLLLLLTTLSCKERKTKQDAENAYSTSTNKSSGTIKTQVDVEDEENEKYPDDTYCAEVEYENPNTGTHSSYTLTVEVESNEITRINFPNGGWLDKDHFNGAELEEDGTTSFISDKGYYYDITIIRNSINCFSDKRERAIQCNGETEDGDQCENMTDNENGLCWQHENQD